MEGSRSVFQSTLPLRGATGNFPDRYSHASNFNPHSPCGERPNTEYMYPIDAISIHTPLAGSDGTSLRAALLQQISIHTPLAGSDYWWFRAFRPSRNFNPHSPCGERHNPHCCLGRLKYFNPHSPCGERQCFITQYVCHLQFQSTLPLRGATANASTPTAVVKFQSTLPLRGATATVKHNIASLPYFNPHSPCGERPVGGFCEIRVRVYFNPHSPCGERPVWTSSAVTRLNFNPHSPCGERPYCGRWCSKLFDFNPHSPCGERPPVCAATRGLGVSISIHTPLAGSDRNPHEIKHQLGRISIHTPLAGSDRSRPTYPM